MGSHSATLGRASVPASVLLEQLAQAAADAFTEGLPKQRTRHRAPETAAPAAISSATATAGETTRVMRPVSAQMYGAAALAVTVIGGAAAATATFGTGAFDIGTTAADLSVALPQSAPAAPATEPVTQILPAAAAKAGPAGADHPTAQGSTIAAGILAQAAAIPAAIPAAVPAAAPAAVPAVAAAPAKAAPAAAPTPAQAISLGSPTAAKALNTAMGMIGKPYVWGAAGPNAFDCSGLVMWAYKQWGINLPHSSAAQSQIGTPVAKSDLRPGDLVFFYSPVSHVGIYVGNGNVLNASEPGEPVKLSKLANMPFHNARRL